MSEILGACGAALSALAFWLFNLLTFLRLTWLPLTLLSLTGFGWHYWSGEASISAMTGGTLFAPPYIGSVDGVLIWITLQLVAISSAAVAVHRAVLLDERRRGTLFHFRFGRGEAVYFGLGIIAYALMMALIAGQYLAQLTTPDISLSLFATVAKPFSDLGLASLSMFLFPGELDIFSMPPLNYALWAGLVFLAFAVMLFLSPWPAVAAAEEAFALPTVLGLTWGHIGAVVAYFATIAAVAGALFFALSLAGLSALAVAGSDGIGAFLASLSNAAPDTSLSVEMRGILNERRLALFQEVARFVSNILGVSLGATLISKLALYLHALRER